ncbi:thiamine phosphate synthase [Pelistega europaea]|uniref:Thiamine-phosphate synthase n=1 Tax=Pelistega europaea TaxID=106147 RepID=A0A7Y4P637_9BURK|nr:thiamine phosphate synthase [Pelistega europaea]NOL50413.1 thiamine phosphate synthase [Pelistega europaea]
MTIATRFPTGLYGITPDWSDFDRLYHAIEQACAAGLPILQWRRKHTPFELACEQARRVALCCQHHGTLFVVNDDWRLALEVGADAVHLGRDDGDIQEAKADIAAASKHLLIGVSCYNQIELAQQAIANEVDYFAFGAVFPSTVKPDAVHAPLHLFEEAKQLLTASLSPQLPNSMLNASDTTATVDSLDMILTPPTRPTIVGIGGITLSNAKQVIDAGADSIAVISGLFETADIYQTCKDFMTLFATKH